MGTVARMATRNDVTALAQLRRSWTTELGAAVEDPRFAATFAAWLARAPAWLAILAAGAGAPDSAATGQAGRAHQA